MPHAKHRMIVMVYDNDYVNDDYDVDNDDDNDSYGLHG